MSKHSLCESPHCPLCRTETPILCDEIKIDDKFIIKTTQRERDLAKIVIFFYDKCKDDIMDKIKLNQFLKIQTKPLKILWNRCQLWHHFQRWY